MAADLHRAADAGALQIGTPNILSMAPLQGSLALIQRAKLVRLRHKSLALTEFLMELADQGLREYGFEIVNPREPERRGGHVALRHPEAARIGKALRSAGIIPDHRPPDLLRMAPAPLYTRFIDCVGAISALKWIMQTRSYEQTLDGRGLVP